MNFRRQCVLRWALLLGAGASLYAASPARSPGSGSSASFAESAKPADYVLQPEDQLRVNVFQEEDINKQGEVTISQESSITLPLIGTVSLKGLTARQAEDKIRALYDKDYLVNPQVTVTVQKYAERSVNVFGSVKEAGRILFPPERGLTLLDAISGAKGHDRLASLKAVKLTRKLPNGDTVTETIDVDAIIKDGRKDIPLQPGDQIYIPERIL